MAVPKPKLDLFNDSPCLISKKCRTSTPSLRPPKPPTKSSKHIIRQRGYYLEHNSNQQLLEVADTNYNGQDSVCTNTTNNNNNTYDHYDSNCFNRSANSSFQFHFPSLNESTTSQFHDGSFLFAQFDDSNRMLQQFEIISKIGSGYFADVYKARSFKDGQYYAIKKTSIPFTSNSDRLRRLKEVKNHRLLPSHPNCVKYYDSWEEDGLLYIQTELCKTSLNGLLETSEEQRLPENVVWNYLLDLLLAVKHLHDHDLLHLDIKPDNIFISFDGVAKLGDFGLVCNCFDLNSSTISDYSLITAHQRRGYRHQEYKYNQKQQKQQQEQHRKQQQYEDTLPPPSLISESPMPTEDTSTIDAISENHDISMIDGDFEDSFMVHNNQPSNHDDSGIINRSDESIDSIDEGDSKYLASETMQGKFTKAADIFSLGITIFEVASGLDLPQGGEIYHKLRHNKIDDLYFDGLSADLVKVIKMMMEEDYTKRPTVDELLQLDVIRLRKPTLFG